MQDPKADETRRDLSNSTHEEPIANTSRMFSPRVEHRADEHETRCNGPLTRTKDEPNNEETGKVLASGMTAQDNGPDKNVQTHPFTNGELLQSQVLRKLENKITKVEDRSQPVILVSGEMSSFPISVSSDTGVEV